MNRITRVGITGFRKLHDMDLETRPLMVLIGANGVGKTTMLDAFSIMSASASGNLNKVLSHYGGMPSLLTRGVSEELSFSVKMEVPNEAPLDYRVKLEQSANGYTIPLEVLSQSREGYDDPFKHIDSAYRNIRYFEVEKTKLVRPNWDHNPFETSLSQVPKMFRQPEDLRRILGTIDHCHVLDVSARAPIKLPQPMKPAEKPGLNGEDLVPYLYYMREIEPDSYEIIVDTLKAAFPDFEGLGFPPVAAGLLTMTWRDRHFGKPMFLNELSEGTLRFLWLVSILHNPTLSTVTMIDEPEVSLHPELLQLLADTMREASRRTQLIVATHSDRLVRFLKPEEIVVMNAEEDGCTSAAWADSLDLEQWLAEYSLDEIWRMGRMGARS